MIFIGACALFLDVAALDAADAPPATVAPPPVSEAQLVELFRPLQTEIAALSPDGKLLAYSRREDDALYVIVIAIDQPETVKAKVLVLRDQDATPTLSPTTSERTPARITWLGWATPARLVMETNHAIPLAGGSDITTTWQTAAGALVAVDADGTNARMLLTARDLPVLAERPPVPVPSENRMVAPDGRVFDDRVPSGATGAARPEWRVPRFFDFSPEKPDEILVLAEEPPKFGLYAVNVHTGKRRHLEDHTTDASMLTLIDRQGRSRVGVPNSTLRRFPHRFSLQTRRFARPWQALDEFVTEADRGFHVSPENYFGQRAVPLAFDDDGKRLYFASNLGRDTFGIYSLVVASGERGGLGVENPHVDLWEPDAGVFPDAGLFLPSLQDGPPAPVPFNPVAAGDGDPGDPDPLEIVLAGAPPGSTELHQPYRDGPLVFDRFTRDLVGIRYHATRPTTSWLRPELAGVQAQLESSLPGHSVEIQQWDQTANRFLVLLRSPADPGSFCVFDRTTGRLAQFAPRLPPRSTPSPTTLEFHFAGAEGIPIAGFLTVPTAPRLKPIPMVILCPTFPWERAPWDYRAAREAFSAMGFVVVQFQGRGAWGAGWRRREAIKSGYEEAQVADVIAVIDHLTKHYHVNPHRVALYGEQHGGFVALRGMQLHPDRFRCAVAVNAPVDLAAWQKELFWNDETFGPLLTASYFGDAERLRAAPLVRETPQLKRPALLVHYRGRPGGTTTRTFLAARRLADALKSPDAPDTFLEVERDFMEGLPIAQARAFARIAEFLNLTVYDYTVETGPEKVIEE